MGYGDRTIAQWLFQGHPLTLRAFPRRAESTWLIGQCLNKNGGEPVHISGESLLVILLVGVIAGWLAGKIVRGAGLGIFGDLLFGILGAFVGNWVLPRLGIHLGAGIVGAVINATIGATLLLLVVRLLRGGGGWRGRSGRRW